MTAWLPLLLVSLATCLLLIIPGGILLVAAGRRGADVLLLAPAASVSLIALSAIGLGASHIPWGPLPIAVITLVCAALVLITRVLLRRFTPIGALSTTDRSRSTEAEPWTAPMTWRAREDVWIYVGLLVGVGLMARHVKNILGRPDTISQTFDNIFHLSAVRAILDSGNASALTLSSLNAAPGDSSFYPAAWHDLVSLTVQLTGSSIPVASNAVLTGACVLWVFSCVFLARQILPSTPWIPVATAVLAASFSAFPGLALSFGVLYPNLLGIALAPVLVGLGLQLLGVTPVRRFTWPVAMAYSVLVAPGVALSHPNAVMTVVVFAAAAVTVWCVRAFVAAVRKEASRRWLGVSPVILAGALTLGATLWVTVRPPVSQLRWEPVMSVSDAAGQALLNAPLGLWPAWTVSGLAAVGVYRIVRSRENLWLLVAGVLIGYAWIIIASEPFNEWRVTATGVWYTDPYRVAMILPLVALPLAVLGTHHLTIRLVHMPWREGWRGVAVTVLIGVLLVTATQRSGYMNAAIERFHESYAVTPHGQLLSDDEEALLARLDDDVPEGAVIATNPWNGSSLAYPLSDRMTTNHHALAYVSPDEQILNNSLDEADSDPSVCPAIERLGVEYVLDFGPQNVNGAETVYTGFDDLAHSPGFELVDHEGAAKLYRVTACGVAG